MTTQSNGMVAIVGIIAGTFLLMIMMLVALEVDKSDNWKEVEKAKACAACPSVSK